MRGDSSQIFFQRHTDSAWGGSHLLQILRGALAEPAGRKVGAEYAGIAEKRKDHFPVYLLAERHAAEPFPQRFQKRVRA